MGSCWTYFSEKVWKWKSLFGPRRRVRIAYEPIPKSAWCDQKITKKTYVFQVHIFSSKIQKNLKNDFPNVSKWGSLFWWWRLLGHLWRHYSKHVPKSAPKVVPSLQKCLQKGSRNGKSESQVLENPRKWHQLDETRAADWSKEGGTCRVSTNQKVLRHISFFDDSWQIHQWQLTWQSTREISFNLLLEIVTESHVFFWIRHIYMYMYVYVYIKVNH